MGLREQEQYDGPLKAALQREDELKTLVKELRREIEEELKARSKLQSR